MFGELEAAIMACLWGCGQGTVGEMYKELAGLPEIDYTTVKTIMERLSEKGFLCCDSRHRAYVYGPTQNREAMPF